MRKYIRMIKLSNTQAVEVARPAIVPALFYDEPAKAMFWLEDAFGFETTLRVTDDTGDVGYAEMSFRGSIFSVTKAFAGAPIAPAATRSPTSLGGNCTQFLRVSLVNELDAHFDVAQAAGAQVLQRPEDQFYGARIYRVCDPEGHIWTFSMDIPPKADEEPKAS
jgi:uncharacterized glyoxalase superfamily protein PhnB